MQESPLVNFLRQVRAELAEAATPYPGAPEAAARVTVEVGFLTEPAPEGGWVLWPVSAGVPGPGAVAPHTLRVDWEPGARAPRSAVAAPGTSPKSAGAVEEHVEGGDPTTIRRRLEILFGGAPGFNTGAKAGILADLLVEFGRPHLLETLRREWISEFDTGADSSQAVLRPPPGA